VYAADRDCAARPCSSQATYEILCEAANPKLGKACHSNTCSKITALFKGRIICIKPLDRSDLLFHLITNKVKIWEED
jgi:hypothetical protein